MGVQVVYADSETRSELNYQDVELIKRCRRRKSRLTSQQRRPVVILRDTADRYRCGQSNSTQGRIAAAHVKEKGKEEYLHSAFLAKVVHSKRSGMDHTVLPANNTMPAFPS